MALPYHDWSEIRYDCGKVIKCPACLSLENVAHIRVQASQNAAIFLCCCGYYFWSECVKHTSKIDKVRCKYCKLEKEMSHEVHVTLGDRLIYVCPTCRANTLEIVS